MFVSHVSYHNGRKSRSGSTTQINPQAAKKKLFGSYVCLHVAKIFVLHTAILIYHTWSRPYIFLQPKNSVRLITTFTTTTTAFTAFNLHKGRKKIYIFCFTFSVLWVCEVLFPVEYIICYRFLSLQMSLCRDPDRRKHKCPFSIIKALKKEWEWEMDFSFW